MRGFSSSRLAVAAAALGYFFVLLDVTIVNVALGHIGAGLRASRSELQWVVDAYALMLASLMLSAGHLADLFGARRVFFGGLVVFLAASAGCALASSAGVLIASRAIQGVGAAPILPTSLAIVTRSAPSGRDRARAVGLWAGVGSAVLIAGPLLGGLLVGRLGWRSVFWLNVPLIALTAGIASRAVSGSAPSTRGTVDIAGQVLGIGLLGSIVFAVIDAGRVGRFARR